MVSPPNGTPFGIPSSELTDVNKFNYLKSLLHRSAKDAIAGLSLTAANYKEAVDVLQRRFGDKSHITAKHMQAHVPGDTHPVLEAFL